MNICKKLIAAAVAVLPLATFAQTDIDFEDASKYSEVTVYDWWEDSPFRDTSLGNCAVVTNPDADLEDCANTSPKVLGFQRSIHGSNMYGARIDLPAEQRFVLTPTVKYVHVMMKKPADARSGRSMLIGLGKHNSSTTGFDKTWADQELCEQFTILSTNKATVGQWTDVVFPVKGAGNIDIHSLVVVPDCEDPSDLNEDFIVYLDDVKVNNISAPSVALVGDYPTVFEKDQAYKDTDRKLNSITVSTALGDFTKDAGTKMYTEAFDTFIPVKAGETVGVQMSYTGNWMHSFYYLDKDRNGKFEVSDTEATELVTYRNSNSGDFGAQQSFTIPSDLVPGVYRLRGKVDWMSTDPAGNPGDASGKNFIVDNRGAIIDVLLNVYNDEAVSVNTVQRNGTMVLANGDDIDNLQQPAATALKVKAKPENGFDYAGMILHVGYPGDPEHGNPQSYTVEVPWQDFDKDDCYSIPAAYLTAPLQLEGDMKEVGTIDKSTAGDDVVEYNGLKISPAPSATAFDKNTVWYNIKNFKNEGTGKYFYMSTASGYVESPYVLKLNNETKDETDAGLWCIVGDEATGFSFYNKQLGPTYVLSTDNQNKGAMVLATSASKTKFAYQQGTNQKGLEGWFIKDGTSGNNYWNQNGGYLNHWANNSAATDNNSTFIFEEVEITELPLVLVEGVWVAPSLLENGDFASNTVWYTLANEKSEGRRFLSSAYKSGNYLSTATATKDATDAGLWCVVGDAEHGYKFYNKAEGTSKVLATYLDGTGDAANSGMVDASTEQNVLFTFAKRSADSEYWNIKDGLTGNKYWCGSNNKLGHWDSTAGANDNNCRWIFNAETAEPTVDPDTDGEWFYIQSGLGDYYLKDMGAGKGVRTAALEITPAMQWKFVGDRSNCQIVSKLGHYMWIGGATIYKDASQNSDGEAGSGGGDNTTPLRTQNDTWSTGFVIGTHTQTEYSTISPVSGFTANYGFNVFGGAGVNKSIGLWANTDTNNRWKFVPIESVKSGEYAYTAGSRPSDISTLSLWYDFPATATTSSNKWMEYGLPIGNGRIGAVLNGGVLREETQFNEKTLYDGRPTDFGSHGAYANFGWFYADDESGTFDDAELKNYTRFLDIEKGVAGVNYESESGTKYTRRYFTSAPDNVMAMRYTAQGGTDKLHLKFSLKADAGIGAGAVSYNDGKATFDGTGKTVSYGAQFRVAYTDGTVTTSSTGIDVEGASEILVLMSGLTNCDMSQTTCVSGTKADVVAKVNDYLDAAQQKGYASLYADHVANFGGYMDRCSLQLGNAASQKTTNALIDYYNQSSANATSADGLFLEQLYFQYGRYLTIACNNINTQVPANLQGIWNNNTNTNFWHSDIHADVNVQMCYWPAEITGLSEMHMPYLDNIIYLSEDERNYHRVAQTYANENMNGKTIRGWMLPTENNIYGGCSQWEWKKMKTMSAWYCSHLWQHYRYTLDKDFLKRALPAVLRAAQFVKDISNDKNDDNTVYVSDEYSPEHGPSGGHATAFAQQNAVEVVGTVIKAHEILGADSPLTDEEYQEMKDFYPTIDKGLHTEVYNGNTCLKEWYDLALNSQNDAAGHRHLSHLMALYPFGQVNGFSDNAEEKNLFNAAVNSLHVRNAKNVTGWSGGHKINLHARALEGDEAHAYFGEVMLKHATRYTIEMAGYGGVYYNLWDSHSPFQIDGNFGYCAGVAEMLLQSYDGTVHLLPALPTAWAEGSVKGLKAVGNFTVDQTWAGGTLTGADITSNAGGTLSVEYGKKVYTIENTNRGATYHFDVDASGKLTFNLVDASIVTITDYIDDVRNGGRSYKAQELEDYKKVILKK